MTRFIQSLTEVLTNDPGASDQQCQDIVNRLHAMWKDRTKVHHADELMDTILNTQEGDPKVRLTPEDRILTKAMDAGFFNVGTEGHPFIVPATLRYEQTGRSTPLFSINHLEMLLTTMHCNSDAMRTCLTGRIIVRYTVLLLAQVLNLAKRLKLHNATERYTRVLTALLKMLDSSDGVLSAAVEIRHIPRSDTRRPEIQLPSNKALMELIEHHLQDGDTRITAVSFSNGKTLTF